jgi:para-nitrobenzyl esterase
MAIVDTESGKVSGLEVEGVHVFKGIPYGASTAGANRFMPPCRPEAWTGVRACTVYAGRSPQAAAAAQRPELATVWGPVDLLPVGEDCLTVHVWTPGLDNAKRPVMVWLHGGAFSYGSANSPRYDSTRIAKRNDVVVVAVNHRLNIFGHLDLSPYHGRFASSGNAGVLDLVLALEWVRTHATRFGGDPGNVTIFGQSGGGGKVSALLAMPHARGLFHKAIVQSGAGVRFAERTRTTELAHAVLKHFNLKSDAIEELQTLPPATLSQAVAPAQAALPRPRHPLLDRYNFGPVIDGEILPAHPFEPATAVSDGVPIMIGGTKDESAIFLAPDETIWSRSLAEADLPKKLEPIASSATLPLLAYYARRMPAANPAERFITATTASNFGVRNILLAERKAVRGQAPVWMYEFAWETPSFEGKLKACHSVEVPFVFDTLGVIGERHHKPGAQALAERVSGVWASFARTGKAPWAPYTTDTRTTMVFNDESTTVNDPDGDVRPLWIEVATA